MVNRGDLDQRKDKLTPEKRALLEKRLRGAGGSQSATKQIPTRLETDSVPLSFAQERFWFLDQLVPGSPVYNRQMLVRLKGLLHVDGLEWALSEIVRRHEVLRGQFLEENGRPIQRIRAPWPVKMPVRNLKCGEFERLVTQEVHKPFDLARGPLIRVCLFRLGMQEHVLLLVAHHSVFDRWSASIFLEELAALYTAIIGGKPSPLPELSIQYADFAHWQRQRLQSEVLEMHLSYWRNRLKEIPPSPSLPTDHPRSGASTAKGASQSMMLPAPLVSSLKSLSRRTGVTLFMTLLAAFKVLLCRYTVQEDIVVGTPVAGRTHIETERMLGFFVNTLVLRTDLSGNPTFLELLGLVRAGTLEALAHQDLPFEKLVEALQPERDLNSSPLFQILFNLENIPGNTAVMTDLQMEEIEFDGGLSELDLSVELEERGTELYCSAAYRTDLFDGSTVNRMLEHYERLLEGVVSNPDERIGLLPLLTEAERHRVLVEWNDTQADYLRDRCIHALFEVQAERVPEAVAVALEGCRLTYGELNVRANQLAHYLRDLGVGPEVLVGICVERSIEMVVGLLGILKAGGAWVPLDPAYPKERLAFMMRDAAVPVLVTQQELLRVFPEHEAEAVCVDADWGEIAKMSNQNPVNQTTPENLAYVIYTSGSTGQPKGVAVEHRSVCNQLSWINEHLYQDMVVPFTSSLSFDTAVNKIFAPLVKGGVVWIFPSEVSADPRALWQKLEKHVHVGVSTEPSLWTQMLEEMDADAIEWATANMKCLILGSERVSPELVAKSMDVLPDTRVWNCYGPTEATVNATAGEILSPDRVSIGRPLANYRVYILDGNLQPVPVGVPGELYVGGEGLARGYLNRPELTDERFIPDPFDEGSEARLYKTGDLGRFLPDGEIDFLGRVDHQVKIRGHRIELEEIETALERHSAVKQAVVMARKDTPDEQRLVAYVVPEIGHSLTVSALHGFAKQTLPVFMVPAVFMVLDSLPLSQSGKIDRQALPLPDQVRPELENIFEPPQTPIEKVLAGIWAELLGIDQVGIHDSFFELGGHSLLATRVVSRLRQVFEVELPLRSLFEGPTVAELALVITHRQAEGADGEALDRILRELEGLSDEEASALLHRASQSSEDV